MVRMNVVKLSVIVILSAVVMSGCSMNRTTDEGGESRTIIGVVHETTSTPSSTTFALGGKTSEGTVTPIGTSFNDSRSKVQEAKALRNTILHQFEGPGTFQGSSSVSNEANRLISGQ